MEKNPTKFLDTEIIRRGGGIAKKVYNKSKKLTVFGLQKFLPDASVMP